MRILWFIREINGFKKKHVIVIAVVKLTLRFFQMANGEYEYHRKQQEPRPSKAPSSLSLTSHDEYLFCATQPACFERSQLKKQRDTCSPAYPQGQQVNDVSKRENRRYTRDASRFR